MKDIEGYMGKYQINDDGEIYSTAKNRLLKPCKSIRGYMVVSLNKKTRAVHQVMAETFIDSEYKSKGLVVDHIDRDKTNNNLSNLRIVSKSVNFINSDYYESMKRAKVQVRANGSFRVRMQVKGRMFDKTFQDEASANSYLNSINK